MDTLDRLYLDYLEGTITREQYDKAVLAYKSTPQPERDRYGI